MTEPNELDEKGASGGSAATSCYVVLELDNVEFQCLVNMLRDFRTEAKRIGGPSGAESALIERVLREESQILAKVRTDAT